MEQKTIKIGIPKGSLQAYTLEIFRSAGFAMDVPKKKYVVGIDDPEINCFLLRPQEIPRYVQDGKLDAGITGDDWIADSGANVVEICDLRYAKQGIQKVKWVLAVPQDSPIKTVQDLKGKLISTELVNLTSSYLKRNNVEATIEFSWGATEVKPPLFADAIVDLIETGAAFRAHKLKIIDTIFESSTKFIAAKTAWSDDWKKEKIEALALLLKGVVESRTTVGISMHIPREKLESILQELPSMRKPTVKKIAGINWYEVFVATDEKETRTLIPKLKKLGCEDIAEYPLQIVVR